MERQADVSRHGAGGGGEGAQIEAGRAPRPILCLINEAWFFRSHFLPWAVAAREAGFAVTVVGAPDDTAAGTEEAGIRFLAGRARRGGWRPQGLWGAARELQGLCARLEPAVVHVFGLHGMVIAALAGIAGLRRPLVVSVTGLGILATARGARHAAMRAVIRLMARRLDRAGAVWLCENPHDPAALGLERAQRDGRVVLLTGAGVDTAAFAPMPLPERPPLRLVLVARMVHSKGVDLAVAAVARARAAGLDVTLSLVGAPDPANPLSLDAGALAAFGRVAGVSHLGRRTDVAALLAEHHLFILPSRGGEGLPKALLEAAAAGRAAVVTAVPGCRDFVVDGETGFLVPPEDVAALTAAIFRASKADLAAMGAAARAAVEESASLATVSGRVVDIYRALAAPAAP